MALLTVEIPEKLLAKLRRSGRPEQEVIVEALEQTLDLSSQAKHKSKHEESDARTNRSEEPIRPNKRKSQPLEKNLPREEVMRRLVAAGLIREPGSWDTKGAREWRELPETVKEELIREASEMSFSDSSISRSVIAQRQLQASEPTREEIVAQLVNRGLIPAPGSWDDDYARAWRNRTEEEQRKLIDEMHNTFFPDSFASQLISENRR